MLYIIIGLILTIISFIGYNYEDRKLSKKFISDWSSIFPSLFNGFIGALISMVIASIPFELLPSQIDIKAYELEKLNNDYFEISASDDLVTVYVSSEDDTFKIKSYDKEKVTFKKGDIAEIEVVNKVKKLNEKQRFWFWFDDKEKLESVTITIPETTLTQFPDCCGKCENAECFIVNIKQN